MRNDDNLFSLDELGTSKAAVRRCYENNYADRDNKDWDARVREMLASRRTRWTIDELEDLIAVFSTPHHDCVLENADDFSPLEVARHVKLEEQIERWSFLIHQRRLADK